MILGFEVSNQTLSRTENSKTVEKSHNYLVCKFNFVTDDWTGTTKAALFKTTDMEKPVIRLLVNDECDFPNGTSVGNCSIAVIGGRAEDIGNITTGKKVSDTGRIITTNTINIVFEDTLDTECIADLSDPENDFTKFLTEIGAIVDRKVGDLALLDTDNKSDIVSAINSLDDKVVKNENIMIDNYTELLNIDAKVGDIGDLEVITNLQNTVSAINVVHRAAENNRNNLKGLEYRVDSIEDSIDNIENTYATKKEQGDLSSLDTTDKTSIVGAINEVNAKAEEELERLQYYGDKDIVPSAASYFTVNETGETITGLADTGKTQTELVIPYKIDGKEIISIGTGAFRSPSITIPNSVTSTGTDAFYDCLTSITIPNSVISIGSGAFENCESLTSINIPNSVTSIENGAFYNCNSLTSITIPNNVTSIGDITFYNCNSLTSINIPNSVTSIGDFAFAYCSSLTSINIPNSVTSIETDAFYNRTNITIYCEQGSYAETYAKEHNIPYRYTEVEPIVGNLTELETTDKSSIVSAVNEVKSKTNSIADNTTVIVHEYGGFAAGRGAVVQQENNSGSPIAIGWSAKAKYNGIAIGAAAKSTGAGVTMGQGAECDGSGFAAGYGAKTGHGIAIGDQAKAVGANGKGIDAVQLGKGTNNTPKTMQVYDKRIVEADGSLTDVGNLSNLNTADKSSVVNAINEVNSKSENIDLSGYATKEELNAISEKYTGFGASYWEAFFKEGRTDFSYAFINNGAAEIKPTQVINASVISYILLNCSNIVDASPVVINLTSNKPTCVSICMGCVLMEKPPTINFTGENAHVVRSYVCAFTNCINLTEAVIWFGDGTQSASGERTDMANAFMNCNELQHLAFTGNGSPKNLDLSSCKKLTLASIQTLEAALMDVSEETSGTYEITISSETAALMPEELTTAFTVKGWTLNIKEETTA